MTIRESLRTGVGIALIFCIMFFIQVGKVTEKRGMEPQEVKTRLGTVTLKTSTPASESTGTPDDIPPVPSPQLSSPSSTSEQVTSQPEGQPSSCIHGIEELQGDLLSRSDLLRLAETAREHMIGTFKEDYGEYFDDIFVGPDKGFTPWSATSNDRLKRKLMIKVLDMQTTLLNNDCDSDDDSNTFVNYVWATGGHSSAAGHGNLFNESYTAVLGRDARIVFQAIGIHFEDRNYAMGGTTSGSEISMCWEQVFGNDVDFFSWDYGLTDVRDYHALMHYGYRGGISTGRPAFLGKNVGGQTRRDREKVLADLEALGMAVCYGSEEFDAAGSQGVPDSAAGLTQDQIDALPRLVRNFKCGDEFENGEPFCDTEKYSKDICPIRKGQTSWHPGFKSHAMDGHSLALFLTGALVDALSDLASHPISDPLELLAELRTAEDSQYEQLLQAELPAMKNQIYFPGDNSAPDPALDLDILWKGPSLCRTARTPSQTRYLGYATNSEKVGGVAIVGSEEYDTGIPVVEARGATATQGGVLVLAYEGDRDSCSDAVVKPDYKDYFYANKLYEWATLSIPNEKESVAYGYNPLKVQGLIFLSFVSCDWGKCEHKELRPQHYTEHKFEMKVNGKVVSEMVNFGRNVWALKGEDGLYWKPDNSGVFVLSFLIKEDKGYVRISSVMLY